MELLLGNCLDRLKELKDNSVDAIVTDPPYGLSFMGKKWDYDVPNVDIWKECLRVLKSGGYLLSFAGTRTQHRMAVNIEDAGFEIRDMIAWVYGSGFPKSLNIGKAVDKINGETGRELKFVNWFRTTGLKQKETNEIIGKSDVGSHYLRLDQPAIPTRELWAILRPHIKVEIPGWVDELVERVEREREVVGKGKSSLGGTVAAGERNPVFIEEHRNKEFTRTKGTSEWEGWGTALKPALEPITVARKPLSEKSVAENCLKWGVGGINIDGCRVGTEELGGGTMPDLRDVGAMSKESMGIDKLSFGQNPRPANRKEQPVYTGRFPANLIHDGSEEVVGLFPQTKSGKMGPQHTRHTDGSPNGIYGKFDVNHELGETYGDSGNASRFFMSCKYTPKDAIMNICEDSIYVNDVGNSLPIMSLIESVVNISSVLKSATPNLDLLNHYLNVLFVEKKSESIVIDFVAKLVAISEVPEGVLNQQELTVIQDFITSCKGCSQTQNPVSSVGKWEDTDITQIIINLLRLCGYVLLATEENTNSGKREVGVVNGEPKRFLYCSKASKRERNIGCEDMEDVNWWELNEGGGKELWKGQEDYRQGKKYQNHPSKNFHPTVKPIALMEYLVNMVSREGQVVLDPFMGSGTTGMACKKLGREFIGIEMMPEYMEIAKCRIKGVKKSDQLNMI